VVSEQDAVALMKLRRCGIGSRSEGTFGLSVVSQLSEPRKLGVRGIGIGALTLVHGPGDGSKPPRDTGRG
jgi:hypothetical protein